MIVQSHNNLCDDSSNDVLSKSPDECKDDKAPQLTRDTGGIANGGTLGA